MSLVDSGVCHTSYSFLVANREQSLAVVSHWPWAYPVPVLNFPGGVFPSLILRLVDVLSGSFNIIPVMNRHHTDDALTSGHHSISDRLGVSMGFLWTPSELLGMAVSTWLRGLHWCSLDWMDLGYHRCCTSIQIAWTISHTRVEPHIWKI